MPKSPGKKFEDNIKDSADKSGVFCYRLRDPAASFGQTDSKLRFSVRNICDFVMFLSPCMYLIECKSHLGKSIPFSALKSKEKDNRIRDMAKEAFEHDGVESYVIFNWRDHEITVAVPAAFVTKFIESCGSDYGINRKSIPMQWTIEHGKTIRHRLKKVNYFYHVTDFMKVGYDPERI